MVQWQEGATERKHNVEYYHYSYVFMCKDKLICCGGFLFFLMINVDLHLYRSAEKNSSLTRLFRTPRWGNLPLMSESGQSRLLTQPSQSTLLLCPMPCDAPHV